MTLSDEILLQIRITSDDLSGVTLKELVELFITLLGMFLAILEFISQVVHTILSMVLFPWYMWLLFWSEVVNILLGETWLQALG